MSAQYDKPTPRITVPEIMTRKVKGGAKITCLTAYHAQIAALLDAHIDILLVGDSLAMTVYGMDNTLDVSLAHMIAHARAVMRGSQRALVVVDMPFGSYEASPASAFRHAARVLRKSGAQAVKLEGGQRMAETISYLTERGIPVMAHIGLTPQSVNMMGGFKPQGRTKKEQAALLADAEAVQEAGAFSVVLEGMPQDIASDITQKLAIPTIGIGASAACDGQVLVLDDMLGITPKENMPRFVKRFAELAPQIEQAARDYAEAVRAGQFPAKEHVYAAPKNMSDDE